MPPKKVLTAHIFVIDLNIKNLAEVRKVFYRILLKSAQDKAATKSQDVYKVILVGSKESNNVNNFNNITILSEWSMYKKEEILESVMKNLENVVTGPPGNVFEALELAIEHIQNDMLVSSYYPKNVIIFTDLLFDTPQRINKNSLRHALEGIWLYILGADVKIPTLRSVDDIKTWSKCIQPANKDINLKNNLKIIQEVKDKGIVADLDIGWQLLFAYIAETKPPFPWYCDMMIGDIALKVNVFKLVDDSHGFKFSKIVKQDANDYENTGEFNSAMINPDTGEIVSNPVPAYKVKGRFVVFTEEQEKELDIEANEEKCFEIKYFVDSSVVSPLYFEENTLSAVIADIRTSENWTKPLKVLAEAMYELKVAAVMKRVYNKGPQFREMPHILFTCPDHGPACLLLARLPFAHEMRLKEPVVRKCENKDVKSDLNDNLNAYLSSLTVTDDDINDGKILYGVSEYLLQHPGYTSQYDHIVNSLLDDRYDIYERNIPAYEMNKILEKRCKETWDNLKNMLPTSESQDNF